MSLDNLTKIATGVDSEVFLAPDGKLVHKQYNHNYLPQVLNWYAGLTQKLESLGRCDLGKIEADDGRTFKISCSVVAHGIPAESLNTMQTAYIPGPTIISFYAEDYTLPNTGVENYINSIPDEREQSRLRELNELCREGEREFLEIIYDAYSFEVIDWIRSNLPENESDHYTLPGEMNVKIRMPEDNTIHFVITDIYGNMLRNYHLCHPEEI